MSFASQDNPQRVGSPIDSSINEMKGQSQNILPAANHSYWPPPLHIDSRRHTAGQSFEFHKQLMVSTVGKEVVGYSSAPATPICPRICGSEHCETGVIATARQTNDTAEFCDVDRNGIHQSSCQPLKTFKFATKSAVRTPGGNPVRRKALPIARLYESQRTACPKAPHIGANPSQPKGPYPLLDSQQHLASTPQQTRCLRPEFPPAGTRCKCQQQLTASMNMAKGYSEGVGHAKSFGPLQVVQHGGTVAHAPGSRSCLKDETCTRHPRTAAIALNPPGLHPHAPSPKNSSVASGGSKELRCVHVLNPWPPYVWQCEGQREALQPGHWGRDSGCPGRLAGHPVQQAGGAVRDEKCTTDGSAWVKQWVGCGKTYSAANSAMVQLGQTDSSSGLAMSSSSSGAVVHEDGSNKQKSNAGSQRGVTTLSTVIAVAAPATATAVVGTTTQDDVTNAADQPPLVACNGQHGVCVSTSKSTSVLQSRHLTGSNHAAATDSETAFFQASAATFECGINDCGTNVRSPQPQLQWQQQQQQQQQYQLQHRNELCTEGERGFAPKTASGACTTLNLLNVHRAQVEMLGTELEGLAASSNFTAVVKKQEQLGGKAFCGLQQAQLSGASSWMPATQHNNNCAGGANTRDYIKYDSNKCDNHRQGAKSDVGGSLNVGGSGSAPFLAGGGQSANLEAGCCEIVFADAASSRNVEDASGGESVAEDSCSTAVQDSGGDAENRVEGLHRTHGIGIGEKPVQQSSSCCAGTVTVQKAVDEPVGVLQPTRHSCQRHSCLEASRSGNVSAAIHAPHKVGQGARHVDENASLRHSVQLADRDGGSTRLVQVSGRGDAKPRRKTGNQAAGIDAGIAAGIERELRAGDSSCPAAQVAPASCLGSWGRGGQLGVTQRWEGSPASCCGDVTQAVGWGEGRQPGGMLGIDTGREAGNQCGEQVGQRPASAENASAENASAENTSAENTSAQPRQESCKVADAAFTCVRLHTLQPTTPTFSVGAACTTAPAPETAPATATATATRPESCQFERQLEYGQAGNEHGKGRSMSSVQPALELPPPQQRVWQCAELNSERYAEHCVEHCIEHCIEHDEQHDAQCQLQNGSQSITDHWCFPAGLGHGNNSQLTCQRTAQQLRPRDDDGVESATVDEQQVQQVQKQQQQLLNKNKAKNKNKDTTAGHSAVDCTQAAVCFCMLTAYSDAVPSSDTCCNEWRKVQGREAESAGVQPRSTSPSATMLPMHQSQHVKGDPYSAESEQDTECHVGLEALTNKFRRAYTCTCTAARAQWYTAASAQPIAQVPERAIARDGGILGCSHVAASSSGKSAGHSLKPASVNSACTPLQPNKPHAQLHSSSRFAASCSEHVCAGIGTPDECRVTLRGSVGLTSVDALNGLQESAATGGRLGSFGARGSWSEGLGAYVMGVRHCNIMLSNSDSSFSCYHHMDGAHSGQPFSFSPSPTCLAAHGVIISDSITSSNSCTGVGASSNGNSNRSSNNSGAAYSTLEQVSVIQQASVAGALFRRLARRWVPSVGRQRREGVRQPQQGRQLQQHQHEELGQHQQHVEYTQQHERQLSLSFPGEVGPRGATSGSQFAGSQFAGESPGGPPSGAEGGGMRYGTLALASLDTQSLSTARVCGARGSADARVQLPRARKPPRGDTPYPYPLPTPANVGVHVGVGVDVNVDKVDVERSSAGIWSRPATPQPETPVSRTPSSSTRSTSEPTSTSAATSTSTSTAISTSTSTSASAAHDCRVCLEPLRSSAEPTIHLGCACRPGTMHVACASTWFSLRGYATCEICGSVAPGVLKVLPLLPTEAATRDDEVRDPSPRCRLCRAANVVLPALRQSSLASRWLERWAGGSDESDEAGGVQMLPGVGSLGNGTTGDDVSNEGSRDSGGTNAATFRSGASLSEALRAAAVTQTATCTATCTAARTATATTSTGTSSATRTVHSGVATRTDNPPDEPTSGSGSGSGSGILTVSATTTVSASRSRDKRLTAVASSTLGPDWRSASGSSSGGSSISGGAEGMNGRLGGATCDGATCNGGAGSPNSSSPSGAVQSCSLTYGSPNEGTETPYRRIAAHTAATHTTALATTICGGRSCRSCGGSSSGRKSRMSGTASISGSSASPNNCSNSGVGVASNEHTRGTNCVTSILTSRLTSRAPASPVSPVSPPHSAHVSPPHSAHVSPPHSAPPAAGRSCSATSNAGGTCAFDTLRVGSRGDNNGSGNGGGREMKRMSAAGSTAGETVPEEAMFASDVAVAQTARACASSDGGSRDWVAAQQPTAMLWQSLEHGGTAPDQAGSGPGLNAHQYGHQYADQYGHPHHRVAAAGLGRALWEEGLRGCSTRRGGWTTNTDSQRSVAPRGMSFNSAPGHLTESFHARHVSPNYVSPNYVSPNYVSPNYVTPRAEPPASAVASGVASAIASDVASNVASNVASDGVWREPVASRPRTGDDDVVDDAALLGVVLGEVANLPLRAHHPQGLRLRCDCLEELHVYHYTCLRRHLLKHRTQRCTWCDAPLRTLPAPLAREVLRRTTATRLRLWEQLLLAIPSTVLFCAIWGRVGTEPLGGLLSLPFALLFTAGGNVLTWLYCVQRHPLSPLSTFRKHVAVLHVLRVVMTHVAATGVLLPIGQHVFSCAWLGIGEGLALLMYNRTWMAVVRFVACDLPFLVVYVLLLCALDRMHPA